MINSFLLQIIIAVTLGLIWLLLCLGAGFLICEKVFRYRKQKEEVQNKEEEFKRSKERIEYSESVLTYVRTFSAQTITLKFKEFLDNRQLDKLTREQIKNELEKIALFTYNAMNLDNIDFDQCLYKKNFIYEYIVQVCVTMTKKMLDDSIIDIEE